ncbi:RNA-directed DNA polymerase, eukaryota, Reverse transcriptase zinc-binding domain protein [Artemisia annua]|uniref:RNA-directed DNA polymerase, eukaryota, Reverse transcriptase zinc-binding domain protein n=1 Tax=Artemisia annua TaxID=35608 RepID=A0A2U1NQQ5_ARTAN|nr:RNA-directed DNA polymerase, eukaryota, Reverse transcriptase zinc-binding domain protein [Artemisia annua]
MFAGLSTNVAMLRCLHVHNMLCMLRCFYLISGLKVNVNKCSVLGVGVYDEEVSNMAKVIGCVAAKFPLKYLGVPVGGNMASCSNWNAIIQNFSSKLGLWKARDCFIADRLSIQDWDSVLRRQPRGGVEMSQFTDLLAKIEGVVLTDKCDTWQWSLGVSTRFLVASVRSLVDSNILDTVPIATRWNRSIPKKVNVFIWRLKLNKLPSRLYLSRCKELDYQK